MPRHMPQEESELKGSYDDIVSHVFEEMKHTQEISTTDLANEVTTFLFAGQLHLLFRTF